VILDIKKDVVELTKDICDIYSVSASEAELADAIESALRQCAHLEVIRNQDAVIARTNLARAKRVIIAGHIDTVPVVHNLPSKLIEQDGKKMLWGRGTVDMKAGVAVQLKLAAELSNPNVDITWVFYDHEEVDSALNGLGRIARMTPELLQGDFAVLCEPSNARVEGGCNGTLRAEIKLSGVKAHSARPWMGENALHKAAAPLGILSKYQPEEILVDGLVYKESLNAVLMSAGIAGNVIPDQAVITVNYRFAPSKSASEAEAQLRSLFAGFEIEITDAADGARPGLDLPEARAFIAQTQGEPAPKYGWTDVARFSALGIPAVNYGPGDPNKAHADDEAVAIEQIYLCEKALRAWLS
jgi:succinyl-diaminopimelate desuccinylase